MNQWDTEPSGNKSFINNMMLICNWGGIPANTSHEIAGVLTYHLEKMAQMNPESFEFKCALEAAKALDRQVQTTKAREGVPKDYLWVPNLVSLATPKPFVEAERADESCPMQADDPETTKTEDQGDPKGLNACQ